MFQKMHIGEMHLAVAPIFLGSGEHLFAGLDLPKLGFTETQTRYGKGAAHVILKKVNELIARHQSREQPLKLSRSASTKLNILITFVLLS